MSTEPGSQNIRAIRELLPAALTPQALRSFCQDHDCLRPVVKEFAPEQELNTMVDRVVDYCETQYLWEPLLVAVREVNPRQYRRFETRRAIEHLEDALAIFASIEDPYAEQARRDLARLTQ